MMSWKDEVCDEWETQVHHVVGVIQEHRVLRERNVVALG